MSGILALRGNAEYRDHRPHRLDGSDPDERRRPKKHNEMGAHSEAQGDEFSMSGSARDAVRDMEVGLEALLLEYSEYEKEFAYQEAGHGSVMGQVQSFLGNPFHQRRAAADAHFGAFFGALQELQHGHEAQIEVQRRAAVRSSVTYGPRG